MKTLKTTIIGLALGAVMALPALASEPTPDSNALPQLTASDMGSVFETGSKPVQVAALTPSEMAGTVGAALPMDPAQAWAINAILQGAKLHFMVLQNLFGTMNVGLIMQMYFGGGSVGQGFIGRPPAQYR